MRSGGTKVCWAFTAAAALLFCARPSSAQTAPAQRDVRNLYGAGFILQDRNADNVIDFLHARLILPAQPGESEIVAAANIAARLGYETSALNFGFVGLDNERVSSHEAPVILVGAGNALASRARTAPQDALAPGEGAIVVIRPDVFFRAGGFLLEGGDATGLLAGAAYLAGRYPNVWGLRGATHDEVATRLERYLRQRNLTPSSVTLDRIVVHASRPGVARAVATVQMPDSVLFAQALRVLRNDSAATDTATRAGGATPQPAQDSAQRIRVRRSDLAPQDLHRLDVRVTSGTRSETVRVLPARPWEARPAQAFSPRESPEFTLSDLFSIRGIYGDGNQDLVPDRTEAYLSVHGSAGGSGAINLAARVGLETAGMRLPFARVAAQEDHPENDGFPILFGLDHYRIERLREENRLHTPSNAPGEGFIEFVKGGLNGRNALVMGGSDAAGLGTIADYVSQRMPYLWEYGKGQALLSEVETEVRRFFQARETPGQVALAAHKLRLWLDRLEGRDLDSIAIEIATKERPDGLDRWAAAQARERFPNAKITAATYKTGFGAGRTIFTEDFAIPWEVDDFWRTFRTSMLPALRPDSRGRIELRVSEPPGVRTQIMRDIQRELAGKGVAAGAFDIVVLSAYKQGYSWLNDFILPRLRTLSATDSSNGATSSVRRAVGRIDITYHTLEDSKEVRWQEVESNTRWLQEIYPIDAVFAKELAVPDSLITFAATKRPSPVYTIRVLDTTGRELLSESFDPKYVVRPFFDLFPEYESVRVTTGWLRVEADGRTLFDQRILTDPERFWDHLQKETYSKIIEYVMDVQDGRPAPGNAPFFDEFRVDLSLSEPNYRIGIDEEVISSLEALHEDIYFETLTLFDLIGGRYGVGPLNYAGRILPWIVPGQDGKPGHARITFTGKERGLPELILTWRERGKEPVRDRYAVSPLPTDPPRLRGIALHAGSEQIQRLLFDVAAIDSVDRFEEYKARADETQIDRNVLSVELLEGMTQTLADLHGSGITLDGLSMDRIAEIKFRFHLRDTTKTFSRSLILPRSRRPASTERPVLVARGYRHNGERIVQWQTPIPPAENDAILSRLATFPGVNVYFLTKSFLGQNTFAADFLPPYESRYVSQAKLNALKPTLLLSGRQHANEVSSTSHILRMGEMLVTDSSYRNLLKKVNVVLHPITNPDGARLAWEMQRINPDFMLHAGYLGALGVDVTSGTGEDPIYPESRARPRLSEMWLPDIFMNMHGYPSHEWVQYFAGYSAWVRGRRGTQRSWWAPRGWFVPGFNWIQDSRYPEFEQAQFAILDSVAASITGNAAVEAMNRRLYARYQKYGKQDVDNFREDFRNGILVYRSLRGREATGSGTNNPRITYFAVTTEAPDETARGEWLELVASAGLAHSSVLLRYLAAGQNRIERESSEYDEFVTRSVFRRKPVLPPASTQRSGSNE